MPGGVSTNKNTRLLAVSVPEKVIPLIDRGRRKEAVDRSQFVRRAVLEKLERLGISCPGDSRNSPGRQDVRL
jgi:hypothetical protein